MTKPEREKREYISLFTDERYAKRAWRKFIGESLESAAVVLPEFTDSKGNLAPQSIIYRIAMDSVRERLKERGIHREPMKAEVLVEANVIKAAFDDKSFNTILERTAGKVKEEISMSTSSYEEMSDEELELLAVHRAKQRLSDPNDNT